MTKPEFLKEANAACVQVKEDVLPKVTARAKENEEKGLPKERAIADLFQAVFVPAVEEEMASVRELGAPSGDEDEVEALLIVQQSALDAVKKLKEAKSLQVFEDHFDVADRRLRSYGLTRCAKGI